MRLTNLKKKSKQNLIIVRKVSWTLFCCLIFGNNICDELQERHSRDKQVFANIKIGSLFPSLYFCVFCLPDGGLSLFVLKCITFGIPSIINPFQSVHSDAKVRAISTNKSSLYMIGVSNGDLFCYHPRETYSGLFQ